MAVQHILLCALLLVNPVVPQGHSPDEAKTSDTPDQPGTPVRPLPPDSPSSTPPQPGPGDSTVGQGECHASNPESCSPGPDRCSWSSPEGITYSLSAFNNKQFRSTLSNPKGSVLMFQVCPHHGHNPLVDITCGNKLAPTCITVPGVSPTIAGAVDRIEQIEPNIPGKGFKLIYEQGEICEVTKSPRMTIITFPCNSNVNYKAEQLSPKKVHEGQKEDICKYYVEFPVTQFGCPVKFLEDSETVTSEVAREEVGPEVWAVTGCEDSVPLKTTSECHHMSRVQLAVHGLNFNLFCTPPDKPNAVSKPFNSGHCTINFKRDFELRIGRTKCQTTTIVSEFRIDCTLEKVTGKNLPVAIDRVFTNGTRRVVVEALEMVSFKEAINFREKFDKFVELGVGGLKKEIEELYRRAFASRSTAPDVLDKLGISHIKGILLYGPPGSGKTLLARTIAKILGTKQVQLINGPEIINKYLGESERNLRGFFKEGQDAWKKHGPNSDLFVIIIDEIDAICKPRGKSDGSSAGVAYDAIVNQLLTLMDGLDEVHNILIIGMTNRRELLDPALLRPGRFEVQIEVNLPDEEGRAEIFEIHTRAMAESNMLANDVDLLELARNTTRFSGAEIAGVVRTASSYALDRVQSSDNPDSSDGIMVRAGDFTRAIDSLDPAYTHSETQVISQYLPEGYLPCGDNHAAVLEEALDLVHTLKQSSATRVLSLLLYGPRGGGKTAIAAHLAMMGKFSYVKIVSASSFVGKHDMVKMDILYQSFADAYKSESAVIILDDLHRLIEFVRIGPEYQASHGLLHTLTTLLSTPPPAGSKVMVVGTMTLAGEAELEEPVAFHLPELFSQYELVPLLDSESVLEMITAKNIHRYDGGEFSLPGNLGIPVGQLLHALDCACSESQVLCSGAPSLVKQDHLLDCVMSFVTRMPSRIGGPGLYSQ